MVASALGGMPRLITVLAGLAGALIVVLAAWRQEWEVPLHAMATTLLGVVAWAANDRVWWLAVVAVVNIAGSFWVAIIRGRRRITEAEARNDQLAAQLDRRISELFSLQELSYVLSESIQLDRIVDQVAKYAGRFLQANGAMVVLADEKPQAQLRVAGASGSLEPLLGRTVESQGRTLVGLAINHERIEVLHEGTGVSVTLVDGVTVGSAAVAPLRSQGIPLGALAVADRQGGPFTTEDLWLLSTVATNASVVLANSRLYEIVRRSKEEWETAFDALAEGIAVVGSDGAIRRANRALAALADIPEAGLIGRSFSETLIGASEAFTALLDAAHRGQPTAPLVVRSERNQRVLRLRAAPLAPRLSPGAVVLLVEDVTEQRAMEAQLIQREKMAAIGQLVSGVAHELNNPLASIAGLSDLLLERAGPESASNDHLRVIREQAERAGRIVRNLLTFARRGAPEKTAVDLNDVAERTLLLVSHDLRLQDIEVEFDLSSQPTVVWGDPYELQQVVLNLVTNAMQAVSGLEPDRPRRIGIATSLTDGEVDLRVWDTGHGVPSHLLSHLFTPFFTTKAPGEGTGLGLSLSHGLVKSHGGVLGYERRSGGGAEFRMRLPSHRVAGDDPPAPRP